MPHSVTGRLNASAREFQAGEYTGFNIRIGERFYNRREQKEEWTNYSAAIFAKGKQADYYRSALIEGAIVSISGNALRIDSYNDRITLEIQDARIDFVSSGQVKQQGSGSASKKQSTAQQNEPPMDFDDDIPF